MKGTGQMTQVQFGDGAVNSGTDFPSWHYVPVMLFGKQAIKKWGKIPQTKNVVMNFCKPLGFLFLICTMRAVGLVILKYSFFFFCKDVKTFQKPQV